MRNVSPKLVALTALAAAVQPVCAQEWQIEEVVVTAQKRAQSSQDVPIALNAFSDDMLKQLGAADIRGLTAATPGFSLGSTDAFPNPFIRGIGTNDNSVGSDPSVGVYIDGVYVSRKGGSLTDLLDIERVEVLKGPQGTLFGRNSIGGAISVITKAPSDEFEGMVGLELGNYNSRVAKGLVNIPVIEDQLYVRASTVLRYRDGWQTNVLSPENKGAERDRATADLKLVWTLTDDLEIKLANNWSRYDDTTLYAENVLTNEALVNQYPGVQIQGGVNPLAGNLDDRKVVNGGLDVYGNPANNVDPTVPVLKRSLRSHSLSVDWDIDENYSFSSITAYRTFSTLTATDYDGTEFNFGSNGGSKEKNETVSQELRLNGISENVDWFIGTSISREVNSLGFSLPTLDFGPLIPGFNTPFNNFLPATERSLAKGSTESFAVYGDASWHINDEWNITVGARYSYDEKDFSYRNPLQIDGFASLQGLGLLFPTAHQFVDEQGNIDPSKQDVNDNWSDVSPRFVVDYSPTEDMLLYGSVSRGFKSGSFNAYPSTSTHPTLGIPVVGPSSTKAVEPEEVTSYELGVKSSWLEGRVIANVSLFGYDYDNLQLFSIDDNGLVQLVNAGKASAEGVEFDFSFYVNPELKLAVNGAYLDARYDEFVDSGRDLSGTDQVFSPDWSGSVSLDYETDVGDIGQFRTFVNYSYKGEHLVDVDYREKSYKLLNARMAFISNAGWEVAVFGNNLTDTAYVLGYLDQSARFGFAGGYRNEPRTFGASIRYDF